jgi:nitrogen fixation protein FixH
MIRTAQKSAWRYMPAAIGGWLVLVAIVNFTMVYDALHSFPGEAGGNAFDISNHYDTVLQTAAREAQLGWTATATIDQGTAVVQVAAAGGAPLAGASVVGVAVRPVGPEQRTPLAFGAGQGGVFTALTSLPGIGRWDLSLIIRAGGRDLHVTRRVTVQ